MLKVQLTGFNELAKAFKDVAQRQMPFVMARTLTKTAEDVKAALVHEMKDSFDRPTPYTLSALFLKPATKQNLEARVGIKDAATKSIPASKFLRPQIDGGPRRLKRFERALAAVGALPPGYSTVPGEGARIDLHGNMSGGQIVQILSYFKAFPEMGYKANITDARRKKMAKGTRKQPVGVGYFVGSPGGAPLGIYARYRFGGQTVIKPILIFISDATYETRFDFYYAAELAAKKNLQSRAVESFNAVMPK